MEGVGLRRQCIACPPRFHVAEPLAALFQDWRNASGPGDWFHCERVPGAFCHWGDGAG